jgi:hypothetical protein
MGAEKTQARNRAEAMVDRLGGFVHFFLPHSPNITSVQEPQQTLLFWTTKQTKNIEVKRKG